MPFPDELNPNGVSVLTYQPAWADQAANLITELNELVDDAVSIEHIGSTSVPGLAAKPCIDLMIVVSDLTNPQLLHLSDVGYRRRPEPWNNSETAAGANWPKMVFAPPVGGPSCNVHIRLDGAAPTRRARLFRDYLLANHDKVAIWSDFKTAIAAVGIDLAGYGQIKAPAWTLLMECAEQWAVDNDY